MFSSAWNFVGRKVTWGAKTQFVPRVLQESASITASAVKGLNYTWGSLYILLALTSDASKQNPKPWIAYRLTVAAVLILSGYALSKKSRQRYAAKLGLLLGVCMAAAYTASSYAGLPMRTTWITVFLSSYIGVISSSLLGGFLLTVGLSAIGLSFWAQEAPITWVISDGVFGAFLLLAGLLGRRLWLLKAMSDFELEAKLKEDIEKQIRVYGEIKRFIPPVLSSRIENKMQSGTPLEDSIHDVLIKKRSEVAILYSDMRNYSVRSDCIDFIENELIRSSEPIILQCEGNMGVARQIGDAILVFYGYEAGNLNILRAVLDASISSLNEWKRIKQKRSSEIERYFTVTYGSAYIGDVGNSHHHEVTVTGKPANLSARIDELTKESALKSLISDYPTVLLSTAAYEQIRNESGLDATEVELAKLSLKIRTYSDERSIYILRPNDLLIASIQRSIRNQLKIEEKIDAA